MKRVLIAEDDPDTAAAMKVTLEDRLSVTTDIVTNGALVLDQITARHPDLLILDVSLPGLNGVDVFDLVRGNARCGEVPVLFVTATAYTCVGPCMLERNTTHLLSGVMVTFGSSR